MGTLPDFVAPQLATLAEAAPEGDDWVHEIKFDGYRILCRLEQGRARLLTRQGNDWTSRYPALAAALQDLPARQAMLDGEVVALDERGLSHFQSLQNAMSSGAQDRLAYQAFDLLFLDGRDLREEPLLARKKALARLLSADRTGKLRYTDHLQGKGPRFFAQACRAGLEGVISKKADAPYLSARGRSWLKLKCLKRQEFVVCGFTAPGGSRSHFGALLVAVRRDGGLRYAGKVGTGFTEASMKDLHGRLAALETPDCPLSEVPRGPGLRAVRWVRPELVAEVGFSEFTSDARLRQPRFEGLREDKPAAEVVVEKPRGVKLTHPQKVLYPGVGITKEELAAYYTAVAARALPHIALRPLAIVRCPDGQGKPCFFQKHAGRSMPKAVKKVRVERAGGEPHIYIEDLEGLLALVQMGALEIHPWGCRVSDVERPDRIIFDLDPAPDLDWTLTVQCARRLRAKLAGLGLRSFVKTTGGKGLHLLVQVEPGSSWEDVKAFSKKVADDLVREHPDLYTARMSKRARVGRVFIDYLRNTRGATAVAAYSTRAQPGAPVSMPLAWTELGGTQRPWHDLRGAKRRLAAQDRDPWAELR